MTIFNKMSVLIPATLCLGILPWVSSCGDDNDGIFIAPSAPRIEFLALPEQAVAGAFTVVTQTVNVPGGIRFGNSAFLLTYRSPTGSTITTEFPASDIGCIAGQTFCSSTFEPLVPADLPILPAEYLVTFTVIDQSGLSDARTLPLFITP